MNNPFESIESRLSIIEELILDIKHQNFNKPNQSEIELLLDIKKAAELLNLKVATIYSKVHKNEIPFMKKGNRLYFFKSELLEYIKEGRNTPHKEAKQAANAFLNNKANTKK